jgi:uncharacterized membrane protein YuzA (DUF378 family)
MQIMKKLMKYTNKTALFLVSLGALNWLLTALADFNLVEKIVVFVNAPALGTWLYSLIGIAGAWVGILALIGRVSIK